MPATGDVYGFVDTAFVKQFNSLVYMLLQQKGSRLRETFTVDGQVGEEQYWEQIAPVSAQEITTRHGDSPLIMTQHDRRRITLRFFDWGDLIDEVDKVRMLIDPESPYTQNAVAALGRAIDDVMLGGTATPSDSSGTSGGNLATYTDGSSGVLFGTAYTGKSAQNSVAFPSSQVVALNFGGTNCGLTVPKLIESKRILLSNNVDFDVEEVTLGCTSKGLADLLNTVQVTSQEFNEVKALHEGKVTKFMGYSFKFTERIPQSSTSAQHWRYPVYCKSGVRLSIAKEAKTEIAKRPDKRFSMYIYAMCGFGGSRMEEWKVTQIQGLT